MRNITTDHVVAAIATGAVTLHQLAAEFEVRESNGTLRHTLADLGAAGRVAVEPNDLHTLRLVPAGGGR